MSARTCYVDHKTGDSDHMNAHVKTSKCKKSVSPARRRGRKPLFRTGHKCELIWVNCPGCVREGEIRGLRRAARKFRSLASECAKTTTPRLLAMEGAYYNAERWCRAEIAKLRKGGRT